MDPVLSGLFPINQIGSDGFSWWIGQIEGISDPNAKDPDARDPKNSGRFKVRIVGQHLADCDKMPTSQLPWAHVMMPVTVPFLEGGHQGATANLKPGCWVVGFYLDPERQKPIIMGSVGQTAGSTIVQNTDPNPGGACKSFTTFVDSKVNPAQDRPITEQGGTNDEGANTDKGPVTNSSACKPGGASPALAASLEKYNEANPTGSKTCVKIADPKCKRTLKESMTKVVGELLAANQASGGKIGDFYVSKVNGLLYDGIKIGRYHIGRVTRLVRSFISRIKSGAVNLIRDGIQKLIDALLTTEAVVGNTGPLADPEEAFQPVTVKGNRLKVIKTIFDKIFEALGCTIEDLTDRISQFITNLLWGLVQKAFSPAACVINGVVESILTELLTKLDSLLQLVLGPIQQILSIVASGANLIGGIVNQVLGFLGISCGGPSDKCSKRKEKCSDGSSKKAQEDDLDRLIKLIEAGGGSEGEFVCLEAQNYPSPDRTDIIFIGGIPKSTPAGPTGRPPNYPEDQIFDGDPPGDPRKDDAPDRGPFGDNESPESFFPIEDDGSPNPNIPNVRIDEEDTPSIPQDQFPDEDEVLEDLDNEIEEPILPEDAQTIFFSIRADQSFVNEGDTITFTIETVNVPDQSEIFYTLSGLPVEDIDVESLNGSVIIEQYDSTTADNVIEQEVEVETEVPVVDPVTGEFVLDENGQIEFTTEITIETEVITEEVEVPFGRATFTVTILDNEEENRQIRELVAQIDGTEETATVTINTDFEPIPGINDDVVLVPSYFISTNKTSFEAGETIVYTIITQNVPTGSEKEYLITGDVVPNDFVGESLTGTFTVIENESRVSLSIKDEAIFENNSTVLFKILDTDAEATVTILSNVGDEDPLEIPDPELDQPEAGDPITDDFGSIIDIPINSSGSAYLEPPTVLISGQGSGASAIALLDNNGLVSEIRVTRGGTGYAVNTPDDNNVKCIIDSFTLIAPGLGYKSTPSVYVDGELGKAEAIINEDGFVVSVRIIDRATTYKESPLVQIIGGGGVGAIVLPNLVCLGDEDLSKKGLVKIGTGKYIDCP